MEQIIRNVLTHPELLNKPPVLVDIGASGEIHAKWKSIAPYSICIAFDADSRDFKVTEDGGSGYKKLYTFNCIVSDREDERITFYLTKSPYCSSTLKPAAEKLKDFIFAPLFEVEKEIQLNNISISSALKKMNLGYVDWFKSDSQGTDLRLFRNLPESMQSSVLLAEFEPGIMDAYIGEDKMYSVMEYLDKKGFLLCDMDVKKVQNISEQEFSRIFDKALFNRFAKKSMRAIPFWAELTFLNRFEQGNNFGVREYLLCSLFALLQKQYAFALRLSRQGASLYKEPLFTELSNRAEKLLKKDYHQFRFLETIAGQVWEKLKGIG